MKNECRLKVLINERKVIARVERKSTLGRLMKLIGEKNSKVKELEIIDKAAGREIEGSEAEDWPDRGTVTIKTKEWLKQNKEEWERRKEEERRELEKAKEIERSLFYGKMFVMDERE
jgi:hypothetical protein